MPDLLLGYWESEGFNQFCHSLYTSINPDDWQGVVDEWVVGTVFEPFGRFYAITRTAFGELYLFNRQIGQLTIETVYGELRTGSLKLVPPEDLWLYISGNFFPESENWDVFDHEDKYLFERAFKKLGPLATDEMYGFEPSLLLGWPAKLENLVKVDAYTHCTLLRRFIDKPWVPVCIRTCTETTTRRWASIWNLRWTGHVCEQP